MSWKPWGWRVSAVTPHSEPERQQWIFRSKDKAEQIQERIKSSPIWARTRDVRLTPVIEDPEAR